MHVPSSHRTATPTKHFVVAALLALSVVGSLVAPVVVNVTHAQLATPKPGQVTDKWGNVIPEGTDTRNIIRSDADQASVEKASENYAEMERLGIDVHADPPKAKLPTCWIFTGEGLKGCIVQMLWGAMNVFGGFTSLSNLALNYTTQKMVVGMGLMLGPTGSMSNGINIAWRTLRDLMNVGLVFLTIFIGIAIILGVSEYGSKHLLWKVVLAAILINFSITLTKFVIDVGNMFTVATYKQILSSPPSHGSQGSNAILCTMPKYAIEDDCMNKGISAVIMQEMKLTTIYGSQGGDGSIEVTKVLWIALLGSIFFIVAGFVFFTATFLILTRFVILVFLIIVSPVGMVAWITGLHHLGRKWWETLLNQSFFLPIMFVLWLASINVIRGMNGSRGREENLATALSLPRQDGNAITAQGHFAGVMEIILFFAVISGLLIVSMLVARELGAYGAKAAVNKGTKWSKATAGYFWNKSAGEASRFASERWRNRVARATEKDEDGNYIHNTASARLAQRMAGGKIDRTVQKGIGYVADHGVFGTKGLSERRAQDKKDKSARLKELHGVAARESIKRHLDVLADEHASADQQDEARRNIQSLSVSDLEETASKNPELFNDRHLASSLTSKQMEGLEKSTNIDDDSIVTNAKKHRATTHINTFGAVRRAPDARAGRRATKAMTESELRTHGRSLSNRITGAAAPRFTDGEMQHVVETLPGAQITNLSDRALLSPSVILHLTEQQLAALHNAERLLPAERRNIRNAVLAGRGSASAVKFFENPTGPGAGWV